MSSATNATPNVASFIRAIREARFCAGLVCVRCGSRSVIRWGTFRGRQRFRCRSCERTFSDLTGTPVAYAKRLAILPAYRECMRQGATIRASARAVGIHLTTSFRWRHRLLAGASAEEVVQMEGLIEVEEGRVLCSGTRPYSPYRRRPRRLTSRHTDRPSWLFAMRDRTGRSIMGYAGENRPNRWLWEDLFAAVIAGPARVITRSGPLSVVARAAAARGLDAWAFARIPSRGASDLLCHTDGVAGMLQRFRYWLRRFRGVRAKYLENYVFWYGLLDPARRTDWGFGSMFCWPNPDEPANTLREQTSGEAGTG